MSPPSNPSSALVPAGDNLPDSFRSQLPDILVRAGKAAVFAAEEFFFGRIRNEHTRQACLVAVKRFLAWAEARGLEMVRIAPKVGFAGLRSNSYLPMGEISALGLMQRSHSALDLFAGTDKLSGCSSLA